MFESLRLFAICDAMNWSHLPVLGGLYDQHPRLLEEWLIIFRMKAEHEKREQDRRDREMRAKSRSRR